MPTGFVQRSNEVNVNNFFKSRAILFTGVITLEYPEMELFPVKSNNKSKLVVKGGHL